MLDEVAESVLTVFSCLEYYILSHETRMIVQENLDE